MSGNVELRHLRYFVAVADAGSLTVAAGRKLHTSQPSLSRQIRDLEEEVGAQLLTRGARGIELTPAGRAFLDHARLVLSQVEAAADAARGIAHPAKPRFVMGFLTDHELTWMPEAFRILREELPNIDVTISSQYSPALANALLKGTVDAAFLRRERGFPELAFRLLVKEPLLVFLPSDHRLAALKAIRAADLVDEAFVTVSHTAAPVLRGVIDNYLKRSGIRITPTHEIDHAFIGTKTIQLQTERFGLNSIDARRRAITCLHTELSHSVCHEPPSQGRHADYRPGAWLQEVEQVSDLEAITFTIG